MRSTKYLPQPKSAATKGDFVHIFLSLFFVDVVTVVSFMHGPAVPVFVMKVAKEVWAEELRWSSTRVSEAASLSRRQG